MTRPFGDEQSLQTDVFAWSRRTACPPKHLSSLRPLPFESEPSSRESLLLGALLGKHRPSHSEETLPHSLNQSNSVLGRFSADSLSACHPSLWLLATCSISSLSPLLLAVSHVLYLVPVPSSLAWHLSLVPQPTWKPATVHLHHPLAFSSFPEVPTHQQTCLSVWGEVPPSAHTQRAKGRGQISSCY